MINFFCIPYALILAQKDDYDFVFAKSVVLYGGKDITDEIHVK